LHELEPHVKFAKYSFESNFQEDFRIEEALNDKLPKYLVVFESIMKKFIKI